MLKNAKITQIEANLFTFSFNRVFNERKNAIFAFRISSSKEREPDVFKKTENEHIPNP